MEIIFKDGHKIEFRKRGEIWLTKNVIWEDTDIRGSIDKLRELKAKIADWFEDNAPAEIFDRFEARLPLSNEIDLLAPKDQLAYKEGSTDQVADYFLGNEENSYPIICLVADSYANYGWRRKTGLGWSYKGAVRLCLEEKHAN